MTIKINPNTRQEFIKAGFTQEQADKIISHCGEFAMNPLERTDISERLSQYYAYFKQFNKTPKEVNEKLAQCPNWFRIYPESLESKVTQIAQKLKIKKQEWIHFLWKNPWLIRRSAQGLEDLFKEHSEALGIPFNTWVKIVLKNTTSIHICAETLKNNIETACNLLQIEKEKWIKTVLQKPVLLCLKPEYLFQKAQENANALQIPVNRWIKACCSAHTLFYINKETLLSKIQKNAELFETDTTTIIQSFLKCPTAFYGDPEKTKHQMNFLMQMYLKGMFQRKGDKGIKDKKWFKASLLRQPTHTKKSKESLHMRCTYARYLKYTNKKVDGTPLHMTNPQIIQILSNAPAEFLKNEPICRRILQQKKAKEKQNG